MTAPVMSPKLDVLTVLRIEMRSVGFSIPISPVAVMSDGTIYTRKQFVEAGPGSKFAVLFELETGYPGKRLVDAIRVD